MIKGGASLGYLYCYTCSDFQALMPRSGSDGYDTMHVCGFCVEFLTSMSFIAQEFERRLLKTLANLCICEVSYVCWAKFSKGITFG
jgi:hypothetical protein